MPVNATISDFLLSLASSVYRAQHALDTMTVETVPGKPTVGFVLPKLDFELELGLAFESLSGAERTDEGVDCSHSHTAELQVCPEHGPASGTLSTTVSGSFVAVPFTKAMRRVEIAARKEGGPDIELEVTVTANGEALAGVRVEFNVDLELSRSLNRGSVTHQEAKYFRVTPESLRALANEGEDVVEALRGLAHVTFTKADFQRELGRVLKDETKHEGVLAATVDAAPTRGEAWFETNAAPTDSGGRAASKLRITARRGLNLVVTVDAEEASTQVLVYEHEHEHEGGS